MNWFLPALALLLLALELTGHITIGVLWALSPIWIPLAIGLGIFVLGFMYTLATHKRN